MNPNPSDRNVFLAIRHAILSSHLQIMQEIKSIKSSEWKKCKDREGRDLFDLLLLSKADPLFIKKWMYLLQKDSSLLINKKRLRNSMMKNTYALVSACKKTVKKRKKTTSSIQKGIYHLNINKKKMS